ncbi:hypothetical protein [Myceligenerans crystallogenes]
MRDDFLYPWTTCGREDFDRVVELLLQRRHQPGPGHAQAVDGRGGDEGIDVDVTLPGGAITTIYQLKYFPEGFSGGWSKTRRAQIKSSFQSAMAHQPRSWVLVIPARPTPKERKWVRSLVGKQPVKVEILGRDKLDRMLAESPDILRMLMKGPLTEALRLAGSEHQALSTPADVENAAIDFGQRVNARSAFWGANVIVGADGSVTQQLVPKRPDAMEHEPLSLKPQFRDDEIGRSAQDQWDELHGYGGPGIAIGAEALASVEMDGPMWFAQDLTDAAVGVGPINMSRNMEIELRVANRAGATLQSLGGRSRLSFGQRGKRMEVELECGLDAVFKMPNGSQEGTAMFISKLDGHRVTSVADALTFMDWFTLHSNLRLEVWVDGKFIWVFELPDSAFGDLAPGATIRQLVDDLCVLSRHFSVSFRLPHELTWAQREEIRKCRLVIDGKVVEERGYQELAVTLNGSTSVAFEETIHSEAMAVVVETDLHYLVQGHKLPLRAKVFHPRARVTEPDAVLDALRDGTAAGKSVRIRGADDSPFRVFLAEDHRRDPDEPLAVEPLGIVGAEASA